MNELRKNDMIPCVFCLVVVPRWPWFMSGYTVQMSACSESVAYEPQCHVRMSEQHLKTRRTSAQVSTWPPVCVFFFFFFGRPSSCVWALCACVNIRALCGYVCSCKGVCLCMLGSGEQSMAGLSVPPDVTLLSSGADPAAEVGRPTAPLLWVGENRRAVWAGWRYGLAPGLNAEH